MTKKQVGFNFLHNHKSWETDLGLDPNHVIIDREDWEEVVDYIQKNPEKIRELNRKKEREENMEEQMEYRPLEKPDQEKDREVRIRCIELSIRFHQIVSNGMSDDAVNTAEKFYNFINNKQED